MKLKDRLSVTQALFPQNPSKRYHKYNSKIKDSHLLLHRVVNDAGYPQEILLKPRSLSKSKDYQVLNKKKISDSLLTPAQTKRVSIEREKYRLDPKKLLVYRKNEMQLKENTKIYMQRDLEELQFTEPVESRRRITESGFYRNSTRKPQSSLSMSTRGKNKRYIQGESASQQLTLSTINRTQKIRAISDKLPIPLQKPPNKWQSDFRPKQTQKQKQQTQLDWSNKRKFKQTIIKLKEYHRIFQGSISQAEVEQNIETQMLMEEKRIHDEAAREKLLMEKIDEFARGKKEDIIWKNYHHLNDLQDLKKVNPRFYEELVRSRKKRFELLKLDLKRIEDVSPNKGRVKRVREISEITESIEPGVFTEEDEPLFDEYINNTQWLEERSARRRCYESVSKFDKLKLFLSNFGKVRLSAQLFGVPLDMVYYSMLHLSQPFSLQGSFLFFKAIASNDIETAQIFIQQFPKIAHQIDNHGRSCLILSTENNFTELSKTLIRVGLNLDIESVTGITSLHNAIKHQNVEIVLMLLEYGASPWSKRYDILEVNRNPVIHRLIKRARRLNLGMKTMKSSMRYSFWQEAKHLLREQAGV